MAGRHKMQYTRRHLQGTRHQRRRPARTRSRYPQGDEHIQRRRQTAHNQRRQGIATQVRYPPRLSALAPPRSAEAKWTFPRQLARSLTQLPGPKTPRKQQTRPPRLAPKPIPIRSTPSHTRATLGRLRAHNSDTPSAPARKRLVIESCPSLSPSTAPRPPWPAPPATRTPAPTQSPSAVRATLSNSKPNRCLPLHQLPPSGSTPKLAHSLVR